jgi:hypothetical protein
MKNLTVIISIATVAVLLLLAVAASLIDSIPFAFVASYVVGFAGSIQLLAFFVQDYAPRKPRLVEVESSEAAAKRALEAAKALEAQWLAEQRSSGSFDEHLTVNVLSTIGLRNDHATLSLS